MNVYCFGFADEGLCFEVWGLKVHDVGIRD